MRARVKSYEEIKKTLRSDNTTDRGGYFAQSMIRLCGNEYEFTPSESSYGEYDFKMTEYNGETRHWDSRWLEIEDFIPEIEMHAYVYALILREAGELK
jgi:hypothetical protein